VDSLWQLCLLSQGDFIGCLLDFFQQCYWLCAFFIAFFIDDVETLMKIVYDEQHVLPKHAHTLAGMAILWIIHRYVARHYNSYRILRDTSARFRHSLYDIWLLLPELRHEVDAVRKEFVLSRVAA
jgi:hypothetical protein